MRKPNEIHLNGNNSTVQIASAHETSKVQVFNSPLFGEIRVIIDRKGEPLFCLVDICTSIGIINHRNVKNRLDADDVRLVDTTDNLGRTQQVTYVTESGMYDVILRSDSPKAKPFKKWVTGDVLPNIRKTGSYSIQPQFDVPQSFSEALMLAANQAKQIEEQQKVIEQKDAKIAKIQPKAAFADCIMQSNDCISVGEMANILKLNGLFRKGRNALYEWLRWNGYLLSRGARYNLPSQKSMSLGIMKIAEEVQSVRGHIFINRKAVITPYGQKFFINTFSKGKSLGQGAIRFTYQ